MKNNFKTTAMLFITCFCFNYGFIKTQTQENKSDVILNLVNLKRMQNSLSVFSFSKKLAIYQQELSLELELSLGKKNPVILTKKDTAYFFCRSLPLFFWQLCFLSAWLYFLFMVFLSIRVYSKKRYLMIVFLLGILGSCYKFFADENKPKAVVISPSATLRSGPAAHYPEIGTALQIGTFVLFLEKKDNFIKIESIYGCGWASIDSMEIV